MVRPGCGRIQTGMSQAGTSARQSGRRSRRLWSAPGPDRVTTVTVGRSPPDGPRPFTCAPPATPGPRHTFAAIRACPSRKVLNDHPQLSDAPPADPEPPRRPLRHDLSVPLRRRLRPTRAQHLHERLLRRRRPHRDDTTRGAQGQRRHRWCRRPHQLVGGLPGRRRDRRLARHPQHAGPRGRRDRPQRLPVAPDHLLGRPGPAGRARLRLRQPDRRRAEASGRLQRRLRRDPPPPRQPGSRGDPRLQQRVHQRRADVPRDHDLGGPHRRAAADHHGRPRHDHRRRRPTRRRPARGSTVAAVATTGACTPGAASPSTGPPPAPRRCGPATTPPAPGSAAP